MTRFKKTAVIGATMLIIGAMSFSALAASSYKTPAEVVAGLTGKSVESITEEKTETGKTYGTIAKEAGKLDEFKKEMLQVKKDALAEKVAAGTMTQERADEIIAAIEKNQESCDGTGSAKIGKKMGAGFGSMQGKGQGRGQCGMGGGQGNFTGTCVAE